MFEKKITNRQGVEANPRKHYHTQGLTADCKQCGEEFSQWHAKHVYCTPQCQWKHNGVTLEWQECGDCGCSFEVPKKTFGYVCLKCKELRVNRQRTDITRPTPSTVGLE